MIEIIKREDGSAQEKMQLVGDLQVSYNDYGHLVIRLIESQGKDNLVVLGRATTDRLVQFVEKYLCESKSKANLNVTNMYVDRECLPF